MQLLEKIKTKFMAMGCALFARCKTLVQKFDWAKTYAFILKHKKRIIIAVVILFAANYAYDRFVPKSAKKVPPQDRKSVV